MTDVRFAISTFLFHRARLDRDHLVEIAAHGFDGVELFALRSHFDYTDPAAVAQLAEWLDDTRLTLHAVHAPTARAYTDGQWHGTLSIAAQDESARAAAVADTVAVIRLARTLPYPILNLHLGLPGHVAAAGADTAASVARSVDTLVAEAAACGVQPALELLTNPMSTAEALVARIEGAADWPPVGVCLDTGHARLIGDPVDAIEAASGHIVATHIHDTHGSRDDHLTPYAGVIDWDRTLMAFQKVGYAGPWTFELAPDVSIPAVLARAARARQRFEEALGITDEPLTP